MISISELRTFEIFTSLPLELQDKVWSFALCCASPRVYDIMVVPRPGTGTVALVASDSLNETTLPSRTISRVCRRSRAAVARELPHVVTLVQQGFMNASSPKLAIFRVDARRDVLCLNSIDTRSMDVFNVAIRRAEQGVERDNGDNAASERREPFAVTPLLDAILEAMREFRAGTAWAVDSYVMETSRSDTNNGNGCTPSHSKSPHIWQGLLPDPNKTYGIEKLGLPPQTSRLAIGVPNDSFYRALAANRGGSGVVTMAMIRRFLLAFPCLETLYVRASLPVAAAGVNQIRALVADLRDPEQMFANGASNHIRAGPCDTYNASENDKDIEWIRGTASAAIPPFMQADFRPIKHTSHRLDTKPSDNDILDDYDDDDNYGTRGLTKASKNTGDFDEQASEEGKSWFLAANPYCSWGSGIPAAAAILEANLWRLARLTRALGRDSNPKCAAGEQESTFISQGFSDEEMDRLGRLEVKMLLWVEW